MYKEDIVFIDTETTGLDPDRHEIWEVGAISLYQGEWVEEHWFLPVDESKADPFALDIGGYWERYPRYHKDPYAYITNLADFVREFAYLTANKHLCGAIVSFDEQRLGKLLKANGVLPRWHYHIIDIEAMSVGWLAAAGHRLSLPWKSDDVFELLNVPPTPDEDKHTALGDARQVKAVFETINVWEDDLVDP